MIIKLTLTATLLVSSLISTPSFAHEKPMRVQKKIEHEKHRTEKEKAIQDLKIAGMAAVATSASYAACYAVMSDRGLDLAKKISLAYGGNTTETLTIVMLLGIVSIGTYSAYKAIIGAKHLITPDHSNPEKISKE